MVPPIFYPTKQDTNYHFKTILATPHNSEYHRILIELSFKCKSAIIKANLNKITYNQAIIFAQVSSYTFHFYFQF